MLCLATTTLLIFYNAFNIIKILFVLARNATLQQDIFFCHDIWDFYVCGSRKLAEICCFTYWV